MAYVERHSVTIETDESGDGTGYTPVVTGEIALIVYEKVDYADGVDVTITADVGGHAIATLTNLNAAASLMPRMATQDQANADAKYTDAEVNNRVRDRIPLAAERVKIVVAQGGATKTGTFHVYVK